MEMVRRVRKQGKSAKYPMAAAVIAEFGDKVCRRLPRYPANHAPIRQACVR
jgi:hypothetical protein